MKKQSLKDLIIQDFKAYYEFVHGVIYTPSSKDNTHTGLLISKISSQYRGVKLGSERIREIFRGYCKFCFHEAPQWYRDNLDIALMNVKFGILWKLYIRPEKDASHYAKKNEQDNYYNGNKRANPTHNAEPEQLENFISDLIKEHTE